MKTIVLMRNPGEPVAGAPMVVVPDSGLSLVRHPVVLPASGGIIRVAVAPVLRIGRLGKAVRAPFAHRYIDGVSCAALLTENSTVPTLCDDTVAPGQWLDWDPDTPLVINGMEIAPPQLGAAQAVEAVSWRATLKTGDMIIPCIADHVPPDASRVTITLNGRTVLDKRLIH